MANSEYNLTVVDGTALTISLSGPVGPAGAGGGGGSTPAGFTLGQVQLRNSDGTALAADSGLVYTGTGNTGVLQTGRGQIAINALPYSGGGTLASNIGIGFNPFIPISNATIANNVQGNIGIGDNALDSLNSTYYYSSNNIAIGTLALASLTNCQSSIFIGTYAGMNLTADSSSSTIVGDAAGVYYGAAYDSLTQAAACTFLGRLTRGSAAASTNQIVIGNGAIGDQNNSTVIGNTSTTQTRLAGNTLKLGSATLNTSVVQAATGTSKTITLPNATGIVPVFDTLPIASGKVLTSSGVLGAATWADPTAGTVDATIINGSTNAVSGDAVFDALSDKAPLASPTLTGEVVINTLVGVDKDSLTINNTSNGNSQETYGLKINKSGLYSIGLEVNTTSADGVGVVSYVTGSDAIGIVSVSSGNGAKGARIDVSGDSCKALVLNTTGTNGQDASGLVVNVTGDLAVGAAITTATGTDHATFGSTGINRSFVARVKGAFGWIRGSFTGRIHPPDTLTADRTYTLPDDNGTVALINPSTGTQTFTGTQIFSSTTRPTSSGSGTPTATSLITRADAVDEIIFNMARIQRSDHAVTYTANGGASSLNDGDNLNTGTAANNRPVCVRYRQINRYGSGANAAVCPIRIASYGGYGHGATGNVDSKIRCGIGMALGASIPAANANALAGRGFGWEIYWDGTNIVFGLFAHDGTTYVTTDGASGRSAAIATGQSPASFDGFFHIIVGLSAGVVSAWTVFTNNPVAPMRVSGTPTLTLAGGPTTGNNFVTSGVQWACVNHSTNTATGSTSMKVLDRLLIMD